MPNDGRKPDDGIRNIVITARSDFFFFLTNNNKKKMKYYIFFVIFFLRRSTVLRYDTLSKRHARLSVVCDGRDFSFFYSTIFSYVRESREKINRIFYARPVCRGLPIFRLRGIIRVQWRK